MAEGKKNIIIVSANTLTAPYPVYPIGVSYIATYLIDKLRHYNISIIDMNMQDTSVLESQIKKLQPEYIAVSIRNIDGVNSYDPVNFIGGYRKIIDAIKAAKKSHGKLIVGGAGFSIFPENLFREFMPDYAIVGEGEDALLTLINRLDQGKDVTDINGLVYIDNGKVNIVPKKIHTTDLSLDFDDALIDFYWLNSGMLNIQTKRGCPYNCIYCTYPLIEGKTVRTLNTDRIIETVSRLKKEKNIDYIFFTDSVFNMQNSYNAELAEKLIKSGLNVRWGAYFYPKGMTADLIRLLKASGLTHIEFGTESISDSTLQAYGKHFHVDDIIQQSDLCTQAGVDFAHFLILAGYGETDDTVNETYQNSKKIGRTVFFPFVGMRIYPRTRLYDLALKEGIIEASDRLIEPKYYISKDVNLNTLQQRAKLTDRRWVFPDEDTSIITNRMRKLRQKKGPLWEYLIS